MSLQRKRDIGLVGLVVVGIVVVVHCAPLSRVPEPLPSLGAIIPPFSIPSPVNAAHRAYLGVSSEDGFRPGDIAAESLLIEILNVYCAACQFQRPFMNELYAKIKRDPELKQTVKMIGIAAGNDNHEIAEYQDQYTFPLFPDPDFRIFRLVGDPPTPFLIFAKPDGYGRLYVAGSHVGVLDDSEKLLAMVREAYATDMLKIAVASKEQRLPEAREDLHVPISKDELMQKVRQSLSIHGAAVGSIEEVSLPELGTVYVGTLEGNGKRVFARIVAQRVPCIDCHNVFFVCSFDDEGNFLEFIPIHITKRYNREWDVNDVRKIESRFAGKSVLEPVDFNAKVDAVTSATISSKVVFDGMNKTHGVYKKLVELGYISEAMK